MIAGAAPFHEPVLPIEAHTHRWRIDEQGGASSSGRCECGLQQEFNNGWDGDLTARLRNGGWADQRSRAMRPHR